MSQMSAVICKDLSNALAPVNQDHCNHDLNNNDAQTRNHMEPTRPVRKVGPGYDQVPMATPEDSLLDFNISIHDDSELANNAAFESLKLSVQVEMSPQSRVSRKSDSKLQTVIGAKEPRTRFISITSLDSVFCRICHQGESKEALIRPCKCTGTIGAMHQTCVEQWLGAAGTDQCEICGHGFLTERKVKPVSAWFCESIKSEERKNLFTDTLCFAILTPLVTVSIWLCINGAMRYYEENPDTYFWETVGLSSLTVFLLLIYFVWFAICVRYHRRMYISWREKNQFVRVLDYSNYLKSHKTSNDMAVKSTTSDENNNTGLHQLLTRPTVQQSASDTIVSLGNHRDTPRIVIETRTGSLCDVHQNTSSSNRLLERNSFTTTNV